MELRIEIDNASVFIDVDILEDRAKGAREIEDDRFCFCIQVDDLGVAAPFIIEHAIITPAVLVVTDQCTFRICGECCLACAGETEEQRSVSILANVGRAVHRHHLELRHEVVEYRKDHLLVLAGIRCAADENELLLKAEDDEHFAQCAVDLRDRFETRDSYNCKAGNKVFELFIRGLDEHVLYEERVVCLFLNETDREGIFLICAGDQVLDIHVSSLQICKDAGLECVELLR